MPWAVIGTKNRLFLRVCLHGGDTVSLTIDFICAIDDKVFLHDVALSLIEFTSLLLHVASHFNTKLNVSSSVL